jgi:hypothetical protein
VSTRRSSACARRACYLIARWEDALDDLDLAHLVPPQLHNTDGDPLRLTVDHFKVAAGSESQVEACLARIEGVVPPEPDDAERRFGFAKPGNTMHRSWNTPMIGSASLEARTLRVETNSTARADALRARVEEACAGLVVHREREEIDPLTALMEADEEPAIAMDPPPEALAHLRRWKAEHYAAWVDEPLPALDGHSPREALPSPQLRARLDLLVKDIENRESRLPPDERYDVGELRARLGLDG